MITRGVGGGVDPQRSAGSPFPEEEEQILGQHVRVPAGVQVLRALCPEPLSQHPLRWPLASDPSHLAEPQHVELIPAGPGDTKPTEQSCQAAQAQVPSLLSSPHPYSSRSSPPPLRPLLPRFCFLPTARPQSPPPRSALAIPAAPHAPAALMASLPSP